MLKRTPLLLILILLLLFGLTATACKAQNMGKSNENPQAGAPNNQVDDDSDDDSDDDLAVEAAIDAQQAVKIALKEVRGAAIEIDTDRFRGAPVWEIVVVDTGNNSLATELYIDQKSGEILKQESDDGPDDSWFTLPKVDLSSAMDTALSDVSGNVQEADLDREAGRNLWEIKIFDSNNRLVEVNVDADSGEIVN